MKGCCSEHHRKVILITKHCGCGFGGSTMIGFSDAYDHGYCKKCGNIFTYHLNVCNPLRENKTCPECGAFDEVETEGFIEQHIDMMKMFMRHDELLAWGDNLTKEEKEEKAENSRKKMRKEINELHRIRREFDKYKEEREIRLREEHKKREEEHKKRMNRN